jgi:hypothetical protein
MPIDFLDDYDKTILKKIASTEKIPDIVYNTIPKNYRNLPPESYGLIIVASDGKVHKKFPCADGASTWLSMQYFVRTRHGLHPEAQKIAASMIKKNCIKYDINPHPDILKLAQDTIKSNVFYEETRETPPLEGEFLLPEKGHLPVKGREDLQKYINAFDQITAPYSSEERKKIAFNIVKLSKGYDVEVPDNIKALAKSFAEEALKEQVPASEIKSAMAKFASKKYDLLPRDRVIEAKKLYKQASSKKLPIPPEIKAYAFRKFSELTNEGFELRASILEERGQWEALPLLEYMYKKAYLAESQEELEKIARALEQFDYRYRLFELWDREIPDPFLTLGDLEIKKIK